MKKTPRDESMGAQMYIAVSLLRRKISSAIRANGYDITMEQLAVLETLHGNKAMNMTQLSKAVFKENANITRIVDKLEKKGFVERRDIPGDRRAKEICITEAGRMTFTGAIPFVISGLKNATTTITASERIELLRIVNKIILENEEK